MVHNERLEFDLKYMNDSTLIALAILALLIYWIVWLIINFPIPSFIIIGCIGIIIFFNWYQKKKEKDKKKIIDEQKRIEKERQERINNSISKIKDYVRINIGTLNKSELDSKKKEIEKNLGKNNTIDYYFKLADKEITEKRIDALEILDKNIENLRNEKDNELSHKELVAKIDEINNYKCFDQLHINKNIENKFYDLKNSLNLVCSGCYVNLIRSSTQIHFFYGTMKRVPLNIDSKVYMNVHSSIDIIHFKTEGGDIYIYPFYIVYVNNSNSVTYINWSEINFEFTEVGIGIIGRIDKLKGAEYWFTTYEHTRVDGTPDMRYKHNSTIYVCKASLLRIVPVPTFNMLIADKHLANNLLTVFKDYKNFIIKEKKIIISHNNSPSKFGIEFEKIIKEFGIEVINEYKFFFLLSDYNAFDNNLILKRLISSFINEKIFHKIYNKEIDKTNLYLYSQKYVDNNNTLEDINNLLREIILIIDKIRT